MARLIGSKWIGDPPKSCDICGRSIQRSFVDGRTSNGQWGIMCPSCRISEGRLALGTGLGQKYDRVGQDYVKTA